MSTLHRHIQKLLKFLGKWDKTALIGSLEFVHIPSCSLFGQTTFNISNIIDSQNSTRLYI